jgi:hypothetical protein
VSGVNHRARLRPFSRVSGLAVEIAGCCNACGGSREGFISRMAESFSKVRSPGACGSGTSEK